MRLFVALDIPAEVRGAIGDLIARLRDVARGARWVRPEGVHLTLKFIGEVPEERVAAIVEALRGVSRRAPAVAVSKNSAPEIAAPNIPAAEIAAPNISSSKVAPPKLSAPKAAAPEIFSGIDVKIDVKFRGAGFFPNDRHPRVFWAGVEASPNLADLAHAVDAQLVGIGIAAESREFRPHLTLARFNSEDGLPRLREEIKKLGPFDFGSMRANEFHLFQSELGRGGSKYTKLANFPLSRDAARGSSGGDA